MSEPVVFISHFGIKEGALDDLKRLSETVIAQIREDKPRTVLYLMDLHFEGADERVAAAYLSTWSLEGGRSTDGPAREPWSRCGRAPQRQVSR